MSGSLLFRSSPRCTPGRRDCVVRLRHFHPCHHRQTARRRGSAGQHWWCAMSVGTLGTASMVSGLVAPERTGSWSAPASNGSTPTANNPDPAPAATPAPWPYTQVAAIVRHDVGVRLDLPDAVHSTRVAIRRLRSTFGVFRAVVDPAVTAEPSDDLRLLGTRLGGARDAEVQLARFATTTPDPLGGPPWGPLTEHFEQCQRLGKSDAVAALDSECYLDVLDRRDALLADPPFSELAGHPASQVQPMVSSVDTRRITLVATHAKRTTRTRSKRVRHSGSCRSHPCRRERSRNRSAVNSRARAGFQEGRQREHAVVTVATVGQPRLGEDVVYMLLGSAFGDPQRTLDARVGSSLGHHRQQAGDALADQEVAVGDHHPDSDRGTAVREGGCAGPGPWQRHGQWLG